MSPRSAEPIALYLSAVLLTDVLTTPWMALGVTGTRNVDWAGWERVTRR